MPQATPELYQQIFGDDLRGQAIREDLHARFAKNPYKPGGIEAQRQTDFNAGAMSVIDYIELQMARAYQPQPRGEQDNV
ncbi:MAG: hypothetical protein ACRCV9_17965 [Burkholderiaceae bacterium]